MALDNDYSKPSLKTIYICKKCGEQFETFGRIKKHFKSKHIQLWKTTQKIK